MIIKSASELAPEGFLCEFACSIIQFQQRHPRYGGFLASPGSALQDSNYFAQYYSYWCDNLYSVRSTATQSWFVSTSLNSDPHVAFNVSVVCLCPGVFTSIVTRVGVTCPHVVAYRSQFSHRVWNGRMSWKIHLTSNSRWSSTLGVNITWWACNLEHCESLRIRSRSAKSVHKHSKCEQETR